MHEETIEIKIGYHTQVGKNYGSCGTGPSCTQGRMEGKDVTKIAFQCSASKVSTVACHERCIPGPAPKNRYASILVLHDFGECQALKEKQWYLGSNKKPAIKCVQIIWVDFNITTDLSRTEDFEGRHMHGANLMSHGGGGGGGGVVAVSHGNH